MKVPSMKAPKNVRYYNLLSHHSVDDRHLYYRPTWISLKPKTRRISGVFIDTEFYKSFYFKDYIL